MTLILGVHLLRKLYLVSDTRVTSERPDGSREYKDDFIKAFVLNKRISAIASGRANLAAFLLRELKKRIDANSHTPDLRRAIETDLRDIMIDYVNETGRVNESAAMIFAGFNGRDEKSVDSTRLGDAVSAEPRAQAFRAGGPVRMEQSVDPVIVEALARALQGRDRLSRGTRMNVNVPGSEMFAVTVRTRHDRIDIVTTDVDCFDYAVFHPNRDVVTVRLPPNLISQLEFEPVPDPRPTAIIRRDAALLIGFVLQATNEIGFSTVGGHIFVLLQTPEGSIFPAGELGVVRDGRIVNIGGIFVRSDGVIMYRLEDGTEGEYRTVEKDVDLGNLEFASDLQPGLSSERRDTPLFTAGMTALPGGFIK